MKKILGLLLFLFNAFNASAQFQWIQNEGGGSFSTGSAIVTDSKGNAIVATAIDGKLRLIKHDDQAKVLWQKDWTTNVALLGGGYDLTIDNDDNMYASGWYMDEANIGGKLIKSAGERDFFIAKTNSNGSVVWVNHAGSPGKDERAYGVAVDKATGDVYIAGITDTAEIDLGLNNKLKSKGSTDLFIIKYSSAGIVQWSKTYGSTASL